MIHSWFVAFFYTGLGLALMIAGIGFLVHYVKRGGEIVCPVTKKDAQFVDIIELVSGRA